MFYAPIIVTVLTDFSWMVLIFTAYRANSRAFFVNFVLFLSEENCYGVMLAVGLTNDENFSQYLKLKFHLSRG